MFMVVSKQKSNMPIVKLGFIVDPQSLMKVNRYPRLTILSIALVRFRFEVIAELLADNFVLGSKRPTPDN